jgi:hypothetical protein
MQEQLEKKKAEYAERMKNKVAAIHKEAEVPVVIRQKDSWVSL